MEQVIRQALQAGIPRVEYHYQVRMFALIPDHAIFRFIGVPEFDGIAEFDQLEPAPAKLQDELFFGQQAVLVGNQGQPADAGNKVFQDGVSPAIHLEPALIIVPDSCATTAAWGKWRARLPTMNCCAFNKDTTILPSWSNAAKRESSIFGGAWPGAGVRLVSPGREIFILISLDLWQQGDMQ